MQRLLVSTVSLAACLVTATVTQALTVAYGQRDIGDAGSGCVGGWISAHSNLGYFRGDTEMLNTHLASLNTEFAEHSHMAMVLHSGMMVVDNPEEQPLTGFGDQERTQLTIDWSVRKTCPSDDVLAGHCKCDRRNVTVDVWIANEIRLRDLSIPSGFSVKSGREIEQFIESQTTRN
ncbi:secreted protein [Rhodopirellula maiorica SM1]|uniref:Secreted protein n=1 Tax=Rhodopirellula maiorica SM1 TaxID=1265738 RepID=M5RMM2_9BACT|nr:hypothetical protein [Rhodopirellula maiorica]EMI20555.1 secreted protein [Rhodopirellula maiorica SM1]